MSLCIFEPLELALVTNNDFIEKFKFNNVIEFVNFMDNAYYLYVIGWVPKKKVFLRITSANKKIKFLLALKPQYLSLNLTRGLKYAFL